MVGDDIAVGIAVERSVGKEVGCASILTEGAWGIALGWAIGAVIGDECSACVSEGSLVAAGVAEDEALQALSRRNMSNSERGLTIIF